VLEKVWINKLPAAAFAEIILFTYTIGFSAILDDLVALTVRAEQLLYRVHTTTSLMLWLLMLYSTILSTTLPEIEAAVLLFIVLQNTEAVRVWLEAEYLGTWVSGKCS
jgi:hypothetical protein